MSYIRGMKHPSFTDPLFRSRRAQLVDQLKRKGIQDAMVLNAFSVVPRHRFVDTALAHRAYEDTALPIGMQQTISQPYTVARQTELLNVKKGDKILEIGTGSGYQAAILCEMGAHVFTIERHESLHLHAKSLLHELGYRFRAKCGDGTEGWKAYSPFDGIIVTAGAPVIPEALVEQLAPGGRLVIPVGDETMQKMKRITKGVDGILSEETFSFFQFVPLIGKEGWNG